MTKLTQTRNPKRLAKRAANKAKNDAVSGYGSTTRKRNAEQQAARKGFRAPGMGSAMWRRINGAVETP